MNGKSSTRYRAHGKRRKGASEPAGWKAFVCLMLLACALILRFGTGPRLVKWRADTAAYFEQNWNYKEAIEVLGRGFSNIKEDGKNAIAVFGKKILGIQTQTNESVPTDPEK